MFLKTLARFDLLNEEITEPKEEKKRNDQLDFIVKKQGATEQLNKNLIKDLNEKITEPKKGNCDLKTDRQDG